MAPGVVDLVVRGVAVVGLPGVIAIGMMFLLHQGLGILRGIQVTLEDMREALQNCACPLAKQPYIIKEINDGKCTDSRSQVPSTVAV